jgi:hypothetical protein
MPQIFNYSKSVKFRGQIKKYRIRTQDPEKPYPMGVDDNRAGFYITFMMIENYIFKLQENHHKLNIYDGAKYLIHSPFELFSKDSPSHQTIPGHSIIVYVNPFKMSIDEAIESYEPQRFVDQLKTLPKLINHCSFRRGCYLPNEKPLKFFKFYTKNNCRSECLANKTLAACGCAQFYMVRDVGSRICGVADMKCYKKVEEKQQMHDSCDCYLECDEIEYKTEQQQNEFVK